MSNLSNTIKEIVTDQYHREGIIPHRLKLDWLPEEKQEKILSAVLKDHNDNGHDHRYEVLVECGVFDQVIDLIEGFANGKDKNFNKVGELLFEGAKFYSETKINQEFEEAIDNLESTINGGLD